MNATSLFVNGDKDITYDKQNRFHFLYLQKITLNFLFNYVEKDNLINFSILNFLSTTPSNNPLKLKKYTVYLV